MKNKVSDQDVLKLLTNLKNTENIYPSDIKKSRRDTYIKQAAAMAVLAGAGGNGAATAETNPSTVSDTMGSSMFTGKFLEIALVVALVVEAGVAAYIYRDEIADFINSTISPKVETVASPPAGSSPYISASEQASTETTPQGTAIVTATETAVPSVTLLPAAGNTDAESNIGQDVQVESTPNPNDNPGLHLGQTKQPTTDPSEDKKNDNNSNDKSKNE